MARSHPGHLPGRLGLAALLLASAAAHADIDVRVSGLDGELLTNVNQRLGIRADAKREDLDVALVEALHRQAFEDIRVALQPYGYYNPVIDGRLQGEAPEWRARYRVDPGPRTVIDSVELRIDGEGSAELQPQREAILQRLRAGEPLRHTRYDDAKKALSSAAYARGYLDARFTRAQMRVLADENLARILLHFDTGRRYRFGAVSIEQEVLDADVVERYVTIEPGAVYDPQKLLDTQFALSDLGYFASLEILPQRESAEDGVVPIVIRTTPRARTLYNFGVGYGTDTGARIGAGAEVRRFNRRGHTGKLETRLSEVKNTARGEYRIPVGSVIGETLALAAELTTERLEDGESQKWGTELSLSRTPGDWQRKLYIGFTHEESELGSTRQRADLLTPGVALTRNELDDPIYTRRGWSLFVDVHGAVRDVLSPTSFVSSRAIVRGVLPLGERARLLGRAEYGANLVEAFGELPASQRFFAGGDQSVRGYAYQSIGPRDEQGAVIGGKFVNTYSIEVETRIWNDWGAALFYDLGGADDDPAPKLLQGIGAGLRYRAPVGSVQVDLAHPLDDRDGGSGSGVRLHLGVRVGL
ncbi:autotransporter assembly complex protein TamA [Sinimarinibacterium thermocellulolyticum]|uniref:Translocation and assembly module subunit TamA n=1 Tax=Sinimarinibacterium thermocellulolyticum TaxID=3170016 RepID=A0ABV2AD32_9GAMM